MTAPGPSLYRGSVMHRRLRPRAHRFQYRVFSLFAELDELPAIGRRLRLFSFNRPNLFSFHERDHGDRNGEPLRPWVERQLRAAGIDPAGGRIHVLCFPRLLGYAFNPLTVYFCYRRDGALAAVLYEVRNTFGESHSYLLPVGDPTAPVIRQHCDKAFYVSPFIALEGRYRFRLVPPADRVAVVIDESDADGTLLTASLVARRRPLTDGALAAAFFAVPLMTFKVIAGIHWEALAIWRKGARYHPHREASGETPPIAARSHS